MHLQFEWQYNLRKPLLYITTLAFLLVGFLAGISGGIVFPNVNINSPYQNTYLIGVFSLATIFSITIYVAQNFLREKDSGFEAIVYTTPISKLPYLSSRTLFTFLIAAASFFFVIIGLWVGQILSSVPGERKGAFLIINYLWPYLVLAVPNIMLTVAIVCSTAWLSKNKLVIYIAGLSIYIFYIIGSIFSNSPLIAGSTPSSPETMSLFAKLDPFGLAAFFEQSRYWTAEQRNTQKISLSGNFLFNRLLWLSFSLLMIIFSYLKFSFRIKEERRKKRIQPEKEGTKVLFYKPARFHIHSLRHNLQTLFSFVRIDTRSIYKGIPFILIIILWIVLLGIEINNAIKGDPRLGSNYARTGLIVSTILETVPFFALLVILFYSSEILWRSRGVKFNSIEDCTPMHPLSAFFSKFLSLAVMPVCLVTISILMGIVFQMMNSHPIDNGGLYIALYYYLALPLLLNAALIIVIGTLIKNKYLALGMSAIVVLLTNSSIGQMIGINHPLLRFANSLKMSYGDMNGFGAYALPFHWQMLCWTGFTICLVLTSAYISKGKTFTFNRPLKLIFAAGLAMFLYASSSIFYENNIRHPYLSSTEINDWKENYEKQFKLFANLPQPTITDVQARVDLYPGANRYAVNADYILVNKTAAPIDSLLFYMDKNIELQSMIVMNAELMKDESEYGHYWYKFNKSLQPGDTTHLQFQFYSGWSPFKGHTAFNSIIENGSFMRVSNFFPTLGYEYSNEITNSIERAKRKMKPQDELSKLETPTSANYDHKFINLDMVVSTQEGQTVIGQGDLIKSWNEKGRNYFHYKTDRPVPFRFALSSAKYEIRKDSFKNIAIEIYFDARHAVNVNRLISETKKTLEYCETNFAPYPHKVIRFAEISSFAEGFAATSYPTTIYMKEDQGFFTNVSSTQHSDVINGLAGHELSHQWWGNSQIAPEFKEGAWLLSETLAKYTELVLFERSHGTEAALDHVSLHTDLYLSNRSFSKETPLYKTTFETPHLPYDKGLVAMYQLRKLIGEEKVNAALKSLLLHHAYPNLPPSSQDLLNEFYAQAPLAMHAKIDELFKKIVLYDSKINEVTSNYVNGEWVVNFIASVDKWQEDGSGKKFAVAPDDSVEIGIETDTGRLMQIFKIENKKVRGSFRLKSKPAKIIIDPRLLTLDIFLKDNEKSVGVDQ